MWVTLKARSRPPRPAALTVAERRLADSFIDAVDALDKIIADLPGVRLDELDAVLEEASRILNRVVPGWADVMLGAAATAGADALGGLGFGIGFDRADPAAIAWARQHAADLVVEITDEVRELIRRMVTEAYTRRITWSETARRIRTTIGLHSRWQRAVDATFTLTYQTEIARGTRPAWAQSRAAKAATAQHRRLLRVRSENIARTELQIASNRGRFLGWQQAQRAGLVDANLATKEWIVGPEGWRGRHVCPICQNLSGTIVPMNGVFPGGYLMPPAHPSCRCNAVLHPAGKKPKGKVA